VGRVTGTLLQAAGAQVTEVSAQDVGRLLVNTAVEPPGFPARLPALRAADSQAAMVCARVPRWHGRRGSGQRGDVPGGPRRRHGIGSGSHRWPRRGWCDNGRPGGAAGWARCALCEHGHPGGGDRVRDRIRSYWTKDLKYPLPQKDADKVKAALGYQGVRPVPVPASMLALVPTGVALSPDAAVLLVPPHAVGPAVSQAPSPPGSSRVTPAP